MLVIRSQFYLVKFKKVSVIEVAVYDSSPINAAKLFPNNVFRKSSEKEYTYKAIGTIVTGSYDACQV